MRVLLVDDDPVTRFMLVEMMDELGYDCETGADGKHCIVTMCDDPEGFDLVLMDVHMPVMTGLEALHAIRAGKAGAPKDIPVLALSADIAWQDPVACRSAGFSGHIAKPVTFSALEVALAAHQR